MKAINKTAQKIFDKLVALIPKGETVVKVDTDGTFMAVHVEKLYRSHLGDVYSVAHYFNQMGDMCCDPDMTFVVGYDGRAYPLSFEMQGGFGARYEASVKLTEDSWQIAPRLQAQHAVFAGQWFKNIKSQQGL